MSAQKSGWLTKEGGSVKSWKKRFCVIEGEELVYYKKENKKEKMGSILLQGEHIKIQSKPNYKGRKFCFEVITPQRTYHCVANTETEMNLWIEALKQVLKKNQPEKKVKASENPSVPPAGKEAGGSTVEKSQLSDYDLLKVIGKGSFGKVMLVRKTKGDRQGQVFAMKILNKRTIMERNEVEHTKSEKNILMKLDHPFLVKLHWSFQSPDKLYFIMDYVNGGELFFHLQKDKKFTEERVRFYCAEIVAGLEHLHQNGVIYRDLKPENLLLTSEGHCVMTDFGLSKEGLFDKNDRTGTFCGTPEYLAPEVLEGKGYTKAVDWWSFGTLMYEMLTGLPPFYCEDVQQMYTKIMTAELEIPDFISAPANDLLTKLLERDPDCRLSDSEKIKNHEFFSPINWEKLLKKQISPPFKPNVKSADDISQIDTTFTDEPVTINDEDEPAGPPAESGSSFEGFTYVGNKQT